MKPSARFRNRLINFIFLLVICSCKSKLETEVIGDWRLCHIQSLREYNFDGLGYHLSLHKNNKALHFNSKYSSFSIEDDPWNVKGDSLCMISKDVLWNGCFHVKMEKDSNGVKNMILTNDLVQMKFKEHHVRFPYPIGN